MHFNICSRDNEQTTVSGQNYWKERSGSFGRVLDFGSKGPQCETHQSHCIVSLSRTYCVLEQYTFLCLVLVQLWKTGKHPDITEKLLTGA